MQTIVELPVTNRAIAIYYPPPASTVQPTTTLLPEVKGMAVDIGKPRRLIIKALAEFHYLTAEQITRLLFSPTSYAYVNNTHIKFLVKNELVERILPAKQTLYGKAPYVYTLSRKGRLLAKSYGFPVGKRYYKTTESLHKAYPLSHILAVNEFLLKTVLLEKNNPDIVLRQMVHERQLLSNPLPVRLPQEEKQTYLRACLVRVKVGSKKPNLLLL